MFTPCYQPYWLDNNELEHYGVLGMKWGIRRTPEQLGHRKAAKAEKIRKKKINSVNSVADNYLRSVDRGIQKSPETKFFKAEKNQINKWRKEEKAAINKMSDKELLKENRLKKAGYTTAGALAGAGVAAGLSFVLTPSFGAAAVAKGLGWVAGTGGGGALAAAINSHTNRDRSEWSANMTKGAQWIKGHTSEAGVNQIIRSEKKARDLGEPMKYSWTHATGNGYRTTYMTVPIALIDKYAKSAK